MENAKELALMDCNNLDELLDVEFGKVGTVSRDEFDKEVAGMLRKLSAQILNEVKIETSQSSFWGCVKSNRHTPLLVFLRNKGVVSVTFDTTSEPTNAARAELCCHKLCLARRRKTKSTGSRIGEAK